MAHLAVSAAFLVLACVCAVPAPEPSNPQFTLAKNSALGLAVADDKSEANGILESSKLVEKPIEAPVDTGNTVPDFTALDNVNAGTAIANGGSIANGISKINQFKDSPTKGAGFPYFG